MKWIKGEPKEEGKYLTIREFNIGGKRSFSEPKTCEFKFVRLRTTNEIVVTEDGVETCWVKNGNAELVDYYMDVPPNPTE